MINKKDDNIVDGHNFFFLLKNRLGLGFPSPARSVLCYVSFSHGM